MVDELLSDKDIDRNLKIHKDNKELDHIYRSKIFFLRKMEFILLTIVTLQERKPN